MENDERGVTVSPTSLTVAAGSSERYRVGLTSEPLDSVTVTVNSPSDGVTATGPSNGSSLVFTVDNWNRDQTVTVEVAADAGTDEEQSFTLTHTVTGGDYAGTRSVPDRHRDHPARRRAKCAQEICRRPPVIESVTLRWSPPGEGWWIGDRPLPGPLPGGRRKLRRLRRTVCRRRDCHQHHCSRIWRTPSPTNSRSGR